ncbi:MAG: leucine--tRNA ligase [Crenarchaeota archaeon]|nr:leucine--tRNA ligase [Thermoproteota archaeon]
MAKQRKPVNEFAAWLFDIASKWQKEWSSAHIFEPRVEPEKPKFFITAAFPYPNSPPHIGHARTYTIADAYARFKRMQGFNVLFPMGFHYTGTPILTMAEAVANGDKQLIDLFIEVYDVPPEVIPKLGDPLALARYFHNEAKQAMKEMGYSIDWRREFTTIDPDFQKMITWQFLRLKAKGYLVQGTHPVGWCPKHNMPVGMHDTKGDVEPEIGEFVLILFRLEGSDVYLPAATLRPETVFGVTNIWLNPEAEYVIAEVDGSKWLVSAKAAYKLGFQKLNVKVIEKIDARSLMGKRVVNPATGEKVPILPASFVDESTATGVVMSVPAHAPYDYAALRDLLQNPEELKKLGVDPEELRPRPLIRVKGFSEIPARDIVEQLGVKAQEDRSLLDEATKKLYSSEYHYGYMRDDIIEYVYRDSPSDVRRFIVAPVKAWIAGRSVPEAREATRAWLEALGYADKMYEILNKPVYCRCGTEVVVKILHDQWFLKYSDPEWKAKAKELVLTMRILPEEMRREFLNVIDWLQMRAAARTRGLGTPLPWDPSWVIESLSDSTIYMAFYTINYKLRQAGIDPEKLKPVFWDYVYLGKGDVEEVSKETGVPVKLLKELRREFDYWYPVDSRHSGRDLVPNHLTFFIFNHVAIFPRDKWPRQIVVNGFVLLQGKKMSKSLRNIIPLRRAIRVYGPDTVRAVLLSAAELLQDVDFTHEVALSVMSQLRSIKGIVEDVAKTELHGGAERLADRWLRSILQDRIEAVTNAFENLRLRTASIILLYEMPKDVKKYFTLLGGGKPGSVLKDYISAWIRMLAPIVPHFAEEMWRILGGEGFVSTAAWPVPHADMRDPFAELTVYYADRVVEDIKEILKLAKISRPRVIIAVSKPSHWVLASAVARGQLDRKAMKEVIRSIMPLIPREERKEAAFKARKLYEALMPVDRDVKALIASMKEFDEKKALEELKDYIKTLTGAEEIVIVYLDEAGDKVPRQKARAAVPLRPAIVIEEAGSSDGDSRQAHGS